MSHLLCCALATRYTSGMTTATARHALADLTAVELERKLRRATGTAARTIDSARYRLALQQASAIRAELASR